MFSTLVWRLRLKMILFNRLMTSHSPCFLHHSLGVQNRRAKSVQNTRPWITWLDLCHPLSLSSRLFSSCLLLFIVLFFELDTMRRNTKEHEGRRYDGKFIILMMWDLLSWDVPLFKRPTNWRTFVQKRQLERHRKSFCLCQSSCPFEFGFTWNRDPTLH